MFIPTWLIVVVAAGAVLYFMRARKSAFEPFQIQILPNWYQLLSDNELLKDIDEEQWVKIYRKSCDESKGKYNVLQNGIAFTVLQSAETELVFNNNHSLFSSSVFFREPIREISIPRKDMPDSDLLNFSPIFWVKGGLEGFDVGITTLESDSKSHMAGDGNDLVTITTIPYALFGMPRYRLGVLKPKQWAEMIKKYEWSMEDQDAEESLAGFPTTLKHKYFEVNYDNI